MRLLPWSGPEEGTRTVAKSTKMHIDPAHQRVVPTGGTATTTPTAAAAPAATAASSPGRPVIVCTEFRGVFFGYLSPADEALAAGGSDRVKLTRCRNCLYWPTEQKGFVGLATEGPLTGCRVGPAAESIELRKVTAIVAVSDAAADRWESEPWK
jgi:hypothetical protein